MASRSGWTREIVIGLFALIAALVTLVLPIVQKIAKPDRFQIVEFFVVCVSLCCIFCFLFYFLLSFLKPRVAEVILLVNSSLFMSLFFIFMLTVDNFNFKSFISNNTSPSITPSAVLKTVSPSTNSQQQKPVISLFPLKNEADKDIYTGMFFNPAIKNANIRLIFQQDEGKDLSGYQAQMQLESKNNLIKEIVFCLVDIYDKSSCLENVSVNTKFIDFNDLKNPDKINLSKIRKISIGSKVNSPQANYTLQINQLSLVPKKG
jgi:hypothetical protein